MMFLSNSWNRSHYICVIIAIVLFPIIGIISYDPLTDGHYNGEVVFVPFEESENNYEFQHDPFDTQGIIPRENSEFDLTEPIHPDVYSYPTEYFDYELPHPEQSQQQYGEIAPISIGDVVTGHRGRRLINSYLGRKDDEDDWGLDRHDYADDHDDHGGGGGYGWGWGGISHGDAFGYSDRFYGLKSWVVQKGNIFDRNKKKFAYRPGNWDYFAAPNYQVHKYAEHPLDKHDSKKYTHPLDKYDYGWGKGYDFTKGKYYKLKDALASFNHKIHDKHYGW